MRFLYNASFIMQRIKVLMLGYKLPIKMLFLKKNTKGYIVFSNMCEIQKKGNRTRRLIGKVYESQI